MADLPALQPFNIHTQAERRFGPFRHERKGVVRGTFGTRPAPCGKVHARLDLKRPVRGHHAFRERRSSGRIEPAPVDAPERPVSERTADAERVDALARQSVHCPHRPGRQRVAVRQDQHAEALHRQRVGLEKLFRRQPRDLEPLGCQRDGQPRVRRAVMPGQGIIQQRHATGHAGLPFLLGFRPYRHAAQHPHGRRPTDHVQPNPSHLLSLSDKCCD